jgi:capsular polysaccharide transport system permease protein
MAEVQQATQKLRRVAAGLSPLRRRLLLWVGLPTLAALVYFGVLAADMYQSESKYTIQGTEIQGGGSLGSLIGALSVGGASGEFDARAVQEYILSRDVLRRLDSEQGFIRHHQEDAIDWVARIPADATFEEAYEYYDRLVDVRYDSQSGVSTLMVKAATAEDAQRFAHAILGYAEQMVNELSERARLDRMEFARTEVQAGEQRLGEARQAILELQREGEEIDPVESASAVFNIRSQLDVELSKARAELSQMESFMQPDSHRVQELKQKVASLEAQIARENLKLVDSQSQSLSASIARFEPLVLEKEFAEKAYESALASLEVARTEAAQQHRYLAIIVTPSAPDEPTHPRRILGILTVLALTLVAFGIISLMIAAAREHARL